MTYALLDDGFYDAPKFADAENECIGAWAKGLAYCNRHLTDGFIPEHMARRFVERIPGTRSALVQADPETLIEELLNRQFWSRCKGGFRHVGYLDHNPSKAQVLARRESTKQRKDKWKEARAERVPGTRPERVLGTLPNPIQSNPIQSERESSAVAPPAALTSAEETRVRTLAKPPANQNRGTRLSDTWEPPQGDDGHSWREVARKRGLSESDVSRALAMFRDHWAASAGSNAVKRDWNAAWRNWLWKERPDSSTGVFRRPVAKQEQAPAGEYDWYQAKLARDAEAAKKAGGG